MADYYSNMIDLLKLDSVYIIGYSDGGITALLLAAKRPDKVKKIIASGVNSRMDGINTEVLEYLKLINPAFIESNQKEWLVDYKSKSPEKDKWEKYITDMTRMYSKEVLIADQILSNISTEVLLVFGDRDGIWYAKATILEDRWEVEIAVPFKTLTFDPENDTWGINFMRQIKRNEEIIKWSHPYLDAEPSNPALAGEITGLSGMKQGIGLDIRPFGVINVSRDEDEQEGKFGGDGGVDFFYNITSNLKVSVTLNTDFAETEVDSRQINLSRFPITFPEKRDFFLEGSGLFDIPRMHGDVIPFFTRSIVPS